MAEDRRSNLLPGFKQPDAYTDTDAPRYRRPFKRYYHTTPNVYKGPLEKMDKDSDRAISQGDDRHRVELEEQLIQADYLRNA